MEGSAPAAGAAPATTQGTNGANGPHSTSVKPTGPKPAETTLGRSAPKPPAGEAAEAKRDVVRGPDGKFASANGTAKPKEPVEDERPPEPFRYKTKLKDGDLEEEVEYSDDDLRRELSIAKAAKRRLGELNKRLKELDAREARLAAAEQDPLAYLKERGADPERIASQLLAQKAQRGLMSPEEQEITNLREQNAAHEARWKKHEEEQRAIQQAEFEAKQWEADRPQWEAELKRHKLPQNMTVLGYMGKVGTELANALGPDVPPATVVAETNDRLRQFTETYILSLPVEALVAKLGPERTKAISDLIVQRWRESQPSFDPVPAVEPKLPPAPEPEQKTYLTEAEVDARLRGLGTR